MLLSSPGPLSTPSRSSYYSARSYKPMDSSPLASPTYSSPTHDAQARRRAQYKSPYPPHTTPASAKLLFRTAIQPSEDPQKVFLRERLQARCREHAQKLRQRTVDSRRNSDRYSDVFMDCDDADDDEDESDDAIMQDELFRRIMQNASHKKTHSYRVSYALEVGSSFDPDMEDPSTWESELRGKPYTRSSGSCAAQPTPDELEEDELEYAEQCAAFADFADLDLATVDDDVDDSPPHAPRPTRDDMDVS